jgi:hypothetical protein
MGLRMPSPNYFPLRDGLFWNYSATDPMDCRMSTLHVRPPVEIEVEDMLTGQARREKAWVLEQPEGREPRYAVEREGGVQILRRRRFGKPERQAIVVTDEYRWEGPETWSHPGWYYDLTTRRYRRVGREEITVSGGRFSCVKILINEGEAGTVWLAADVGLVRSVHAVEGTITDRYFVVELHSWSGMVNYASR